MKRRRGKPVTASSRSLSRVPGVPRPSSAAPASRADRPVAALVRELGKMIDAARAQVAVAANAALTTLYWNVGNRVRTEVLEGQRADYGAKVVAAVG